MLADRAEGGNRQVQAVIQDARGHPVSTEAMKSQDGTLASELRPGHQAQAKSDQDRRFGGLLELLEARGHDRLIFLLLYKISNFNKSSTGT